MLATGRCPKKGGGLLPPPPQFRFVRPFGIGADLGTKRFYNLDVKQKSRYESGFFDWFFMS